MEAITDTLLQWLAAYGYPIVFLAALLENVFAVGMAVPGQAVVLGAAVGSRFAALDPVYVAILAVAAASGMPLWRFALFVVLSSVIYYPLLAAAGYLLGFGAERLGQVAAWSGIVFAIIFVLAGVFVWRRLRRRVS